MMNKLSYLQNNPVSIPFLIRSPRLVGYLEVLSTVYILLLPALLGTLPASDWFHGKSRHPFGNSEKRVGNPKNRHFYNRYDPQIPYIADCVASLMPRTDSIA